MSTAGRPASVISGSGYIQRLARVLGAVSDQEASRLLNMMQERRLQPRESVFTAGERSDTIYFVVHGCVKLIVTGRNGRDTVLDLLRVGDIVGETSLVEGGVRQVSAEAVEHTILVGLSRENFETLVYQWPALAAAVMKLIARRTLAQQRLLQRLTSRSVSGRLALLLLDEQERQGDEGPVRLGLRHHQIAQLIGASRETVSALFSRFVKLGLISYDRSTITVLDRSQLSACARGDLYVSAR